MQVLKLADGPSINTNFGRTEGGWVCISMPELGLDKCVLAFATDQLVGVVQEISPDLEGQVGMAFLREVQYGGDDREFWIGPLRT